MLEPLEANAPRRIGPYELLARLGAGGMGEVYVGREPPGQPGRLAAVKTVRPELAGDAAFRRRFHREIELAGRVGGAHVAGLLGGAADGEPPWLATEYVPGPSLGEAVRRSGPLPARTVRAVGAGLAAALEAIHAAHIQHRDLKPANVLLSAAGVRVIDFGIARARGVTTLTTTGSLVGTPGFMSPEHLAGSRSVTAASDVFCLGAVLCYAATGHGPFGDGQPAAVLYRIAEEEPDLERVPAELRELLARCLHKDPGRRPTAADLATDLDDRDDPAAPGGPGGTGGTGAADWPPAVRARIAEHEEAAERLRRVPGGSLHRLPALPAEPPAAPGAGTAGGRRAGARRRAVLAGAAGLAVAALIAGTVVVLEPFSPDTPDGGSGAGPAPPPGDGAGNGNGDGDGAGAGTTPLVDGVDALGGLDGSGVIPQDPGQRPEGWRPWQGTLSGPPMGCAADPVVLVCQLVDGAYEGVSAADGRPLWRTGAAPPEPPHPREASYGGAAGDLYVPGAGGFPTVRDGVAVFGTSGRLQVREAATGRLRWQKRHEDATGGYQGGSFGRPVVAGGRVFATAGEKVFAYDLGSGRELWRRNLTNADLPMAARRVKTFAATTYAHDRLYARTDLGLVAYDPASGDILAESPPYEQSCDVVRVRGDHAYCAGLLPKGERYSWTLFRHDARTLRREGSVRVDGIDTNTLIGSIGTSKLLASDFFGGDILVMDRDSGRVLRRFPFGKDAFGRHLFVAPPLIADDRVLFADHSRLYVLPLDDPGTEPLRVEVDGAPGRRTEPERHPLDDVPVADIPRHPWVLPLGGVVHLVYDRGKIVSMPLPDGAGPAER
ncbi:protein kinase domain-containing protein [Streptomyces sp. MAR4 CNX-425]|uniref:serine/threonine-protein kinase n=1 Tax=Streptomyces sp. MAR4 CNX-425 TaxID=3406343 RepID=UPI003B509A4A